MSTFEKWCFTDIYVLYRNMRNRHWLPSYSSLCSYSIVSRSGCGAKSGGRTNGPSTSRRGFDVNLMCCSRERNVQSKAKWYWFSSKRATSKARYGRARNDPTTSSQLAKTEFYRCSAMNEKCLRILYRDKNASNVRKKHALPRNQFLHPLLADETPTLLCRTVLRCSRQRLIASNRGVLLGFFIDTTNNRPLRMVLVSDLRSATPQSASHPFFDCFLKSEWKNERSKTWAVLRAGVCM